MKHLCRFATLPEQDHRGSESAWSTLFGSPASLSAIARNSFGVMQLKVSRIVARIL